MDKKIWLLCISTPVCPPLRHTNVKQSINRYGSPNTTRISLAEIAWPTASRVAKTIKGSIKTKWKAEIVSLSVSSKANVHKLRMQRKKKTEKTRK